ncbi:MAG TPA: WSC domain-containing protein, partial [Candidatus Angelobacter sp.]
GVFKAYWIDPSTMTVLNPNSSTFTTPKSLTSPPYRFDVLLAIRRTLCAKTTLTVTMDGTGAGSVSSDSGSISCSPTCSADFDGGTIVTLTPQAATGSVFTGWSGDVCSGTSACTVAMNDDTSVTATFMPAVHGAQFVGQGLPTSMFGGLLYYASVTMQNTGNTTWDTTHYRLAPQNPAYNTSWGVASVPLQNYVVPGAWVTFLFVIQAPGITTNFQWQMVQDGNWFGDVTPNPVFTLTPPPPYYLGCWDDDSGRALPSLLSAGGETVESCQLKAANSGLLYAGLQYGGECFGGNNLGRYPVPEEQCNTPCSANPAEMCGGDFRNSIWSTVSITVSWVKPSGVSYGPPNTLTVQGSAIRGTGNVQVSWRDTTVSFPNGPWTQIATQSTPMADGTWANTIPSSNYCHSYDVQAVYSGVTSSTFSYNGVTAGYCNETAWLSAIMPPWYYPTPSGTLAVAGGSSGAQSGTGVTLWWSDVTGGTGGGPDGFTFCGNEGQPCSFNNTSDVAYGANNTFTIWSSVTGGISCSYTVFGDPLPGVHKSCYIKDSGPAGYTLCANENQTCRFSGAGNVVYGASGVYTMHTGVIGTVACNNAVFGDPKPGFVKSCYVHQGSTVTPDTNGNWVNTIPNVNYNHLYSVYAIYDAIDTRNGQGVCTYQGNGSEAVCPR